MRKLLILTLVLGLTSVASAALQISVNGDQNPIDSTIYLTPSQEIMLDIWTDIDIPTGGAGEGMWALTCNTGCATITGGDVVISNADWDIGIEQDAVGSGVVGLPAGHNGVMGYIYCSGAAIPAGTIYDYIVFHCETDNGPTVVSLVQLDDYMNVIAEWDTVTIHQVPEPASMLLLGLGGLLLRRRK